MGNGWLLERALFPIVQSICQLQGGKQKRADASPSLANSPGEEAHKKKQ
jgi:hypothetical protein